MDAKEQIRNNLRDAYGVDLTPTSDFTKLPDEILANAHLYDWYDKVSIQANVEMSRRLKVAVQSLEKTIINLDGKNEKLQKWIFWFTFVGLFFTVTQIVQVLDIVKTWLK